MRANQAAIQRRVNTPRVQTQQAPSYGNSSSVQQPQPPVANPYASYPPSNANYGQSTQSTQNMNSQPVAQTPSSGKMPPGLNPQQQLQFILNVLGERIAKLELNVANLSNSTSDNSSSASNVLSNPAFLLNAIANHPDVKSLKDSITQLQNVPAKNSEHVITRDEFKVVQTDIDTLFEQLENNEGIQATKFEEEIQKELQTRTELLATEINQVKDMVLQLQSTVINTLLPAVIQPNTIPPSSVSNLESFTEAPLNIIPQEPSSITDMEQNLENAVLPTISEPLTYQELQL